MLELGDTTMMRFRIRAVSGDWQVDDLYVDPWRALLERSGDGGDLLRDAVDPAAAQRQGHAGTGTTSRPG